MSGMTQLYLYVVLPRKVCVLGPSLPLRAPSSFSLYLAPALQFSFQWKKKKYWTVFLLIGRAGRTEEGQGKEAGESMAGTWCPPTSLPKQNCSSHLPYTLIFHMEAWMYFDSVCSLLKAYIYFYNEFNIQMNRNSDVVKCKVALITLNNNKHVCGLSLPSCHLF